MLMTLSTTHEPATDLGFLLYKHPERSQTFEIAAGQAHVFYPEAHAARCTVAMVLDIDPVRLVRGNAQTGPEEWTLAQYVNDRPYVATSFLSVALREVFGTALGGTSKERPELAQTPIPLEIHVSVVPCPGDGELLRELFEPLGYVVEVERLKLDPAFPKWGESSLFGLWLRGEHRLTDALSHIYVLAPVLDGDKHYWVGDDEVDKLLRHGQGWLKGHPLHEFITRRYLKHLGELTQDALDELSDEERDADENAKTEGESSKESLHEQRLRVVTQALLERGARTVLDLGCGEGKLMRRLREHAQFAQIFGVDVSWRALKRAATRLGLKSWPDFQDERVRLEQGSLLYRDARLTGFDAAALVEVIEHLDPQRLVTVEETVFGHARPYTVIVTTPNREYNTQWESLPAGTVRHHDHRFEWTRDEFREWAEGVAARRGYKASFQGIGEHVDGVGCPTQMALFEREEEHDE